MFGGGARAPATRRGRRHAPRGVHHSERLELGRVPGGAYPGLEDEGWPRMPTGRRKWARAVAPGTIRAWRHGIAFFSSAVREHESECELSMLRSGNHTQQGRNYGGEWPPWWGAHPVPERRRFPRSTAPETVASSARKARVVETHHISHLRPSAFFVRPLLLHTMMRPPQFPLHDA